MGKRAASAPAAAKPAAKRGAQSSSAGDTATDKNHALSQSLVNANHWTAVETAWQTIIQHPVFTGIVSEMPLSIAESGIPPFNAGDFKSAIKGTGSYTAGGNAFWCSPFFTTTPGVPVNAHGVRYLIIRF